MPNLLGVLTLPDGLQWTDEFTWLPVAQQVDIAFNGALVIEESAQLAGRPITLQSGQSGSNYWGMAKRDLVEDLRGLAAEPLADPLTLVLADGRSFTVRFRYDNGPALEAQPWKAYDAFVDDDYYSITLRLMQV